MQVIENREVVYEFGSFVVDPNEKTLLVDGVHIHLPAKEFEMLVLLIENNGRALSKEEMLAAIWGGSFVEEGNIAKNVSRLRKLLDTNGTRFIETIPKHGYRFTADVKLIAKARNESVVIERQTVRRLTLSVEDHPEQEVLALPPVTPRKGLWLIVGLVAVAVASIASLGWVYYSRGDVAVDPYEPVRLTDNPDHDTGPVWTRDGRVRFQRVYPDNRTVTLIMNADGSGQTELTTADDKRVFSWSPDEKKILFEKNGDATLTYLANADGTAEVALPFRSGNWSADSKMITYRAQVGERNYDIFTYSIETGEIRNITNHESFDADPSFSPDGKSILFGSARDGNAEIYSVDIDGGNLRRLTFHPGVDSHAAYSPDGTQILFTSDRENENSDVYVMRADGTGTPVKITHFDKSNETAGPGGWSPDGTQIAFFSDRNGKDDIYVVSAETIRPTLVYGDATHNLGTLALSPDGNRIAFSRELTDKSGELRLFNLETGRVTLVRKTELAYVHPAWSPDGSKLAFYDRIDGNSEILVVNPDGSGFQNLSNDPSRDISPAWSPDASRIVFLTYRGEHPHTPHVFEMNADGGDPRPLLARKGWDAEPVWSPNGDLLYFSCDRAAGSGNLMDICVVRADGSGERRILLRRDQDIDAAVSPDGRRVAFVGLFDGNPEIFVMNADGSGLIRLTRNLGEDSSPVWSTDGLTLFFISNRSGKSAIYQTEVADD